MISNYIKIAWRNINKNKTYAIINIVGLAIGLACFLLISLYVVDELSYDKYNEKADRIYRINTDLVFGGNKLHLATTCDPLGQTLKNEYPQVEEYVRFYQPLGIKRIKKGDEYFRETKTVYADSSLFDVFTLPVINGNPKNALSEPNSVVITENIAKKYFGTTDVLGKTIQDGDDAKDVYKISAVIENIPHNSHFNFDFIFPMVNADYQWGNFLSNNHNTYILLKDGADPSQFNSIFEKILIKHALPQAKMFMNIGSMEEFKNAGNKLEYSLTPLSKIHLYSDRTSEMDVNGNIQYVYIFSIIAFLILVLACINFINLNTAISGNRSKEVGIRKALGSERKSLISQFLTESILTVFIAMCLGIGIAMIVFPWFNDLSGKSLQLSEIIQVKYIPYLILLPVVVGILSGVYPSFLLSSYNPITALKGKLLFNSKRSNSLNYMVIPQFLISISIIAGTFVVYKQLEYIQTKNLGFNRDQTLIIRGTRALKNNIESFKEEILKLSGVTDGTYGGFLPVANSARTDNTYSTGEQMDLQNGLSLQNWVVDEKYIPIMGMQMAAGRNFSKSFATDSNAVIINETAAKLIGLENPIGKFLYTKDQNDHTIEPKVFNIIGVVKNFHFESLRENVGPLLFHYGKSDWAMAFKLSSSDIPQLITNVEKRWKDLAQGQPFSFAFMDEWFDEMYRVEQRTANLGLTFALIALFIACLGLFGLATFIAEQRTIEIGIRKVLGATYANIIIQLNKEFARPVVIGALLSLPISYYLMKMWLQSFAYRIDLQWWIFFFAPFIAIFIALVTVSFKAVRAASINPIHSLKSE